MKTSNFRVILAAICMVSILGCFTGTSAAPIRFDQVTEVVNVRPGTAETSMFSHLRLANDYTFLVGDDDDNKKNPPPPQDGRVITETRSDIIRDDVCDCAQVVPPRGFPYWVLLGLAAIPASFLLIHHNDKTPTPSPSIPGTGTPTGTPSATPTGSPSPTPTASPSATPTGSPSETPTKTPTETPTGTPSETPTGTPSKTPTETPSQSPTGTPTVTPTKSPTGTPTVTPSKSPTTTPSPFMSPTPTPPQPVPEPMTILLFGTGLASIGMAARRKFGKKNDGTDENQEK